MYLWGIVPSMERTLLISADLACPPSETYVFRSFTLFANCFCGYQNLALISDWEHRDTYWRWFKHHNLLDYVKDIVPSDDSIVGVYFDADRLTCENLASSLDKIGFNLSNIKDQDIDFN